MVMNTMEKVHMPRMYQRLLREWIHWDVNYSIILMQLLISSQSHQSTHRDKLYRGSPQFLIGRVKKANSDLFAPLLYNSIISLGNIFYSSIWTYVQIHRPNKSRN
jgi:hypothetical protein